MTPARRVVHVIRDERPDSPSKASARREPPSDDAPFADETPCRACSKPLGDEPFAYCLEATHWRAYAWRLEDQLAEGGEEGELSCDA